MKKRKMSVDVGHEFGGWLYAAYNLQTIKTKFAEACFGYRATVDLVLTSAIIQKAFIASSKLCLSSAATYFQYLY